MLDKPLVFADRHHESLFSSIVFIFEDRLKGNVFYPLGMEWYEQGFWNVFPSIQTAKQYLSLDQLYKPVDGTPPLNQIIKREDGVYLVENIDTGNPIKGLDLATFKTMKFDILIASIPQHIEPFKRLISLYQPQAKLILQVGNNWPVETYDVKNVMASAKIPHHPNVPNYIEYHQNFDLSTYHYEPPRNTKKIYSFINCLNVIDIYRKDWELFLELERLLPEYEFRSFGGQTRDGAIRGAEAVAEKTREAEFIFHCKQFGDGFSYGMFTAAACGRPLITRFSDYEGKLAQPLIDIDGQSSIHVDGKPPEFIAQSIRMATSESMGKEIHRRFKESVDYDREQKAIEVFLSNLQ